MKPLLLADDLKAESSGDKSRTRVTRAWARFFSERLGSPLEAATVLETDETAWEYNMLHKTYSRLLSDAHTKSFEKTKLDTVANQLRAHPLFLVGSPVQELVKLAPGHKFQMMVLGTHGREGIKRMFLGSVAEEIVRQSEIPVCVLGPQVQKNGVLPPKSGKLNIVVATDLGKGSRAAETFAVKLAKQIGASITLVHCAYQGQSPMIQMALGSPEGQAAVAEMFKDLTKTLTAQLKKKQQSIEKAGVECKINLDKRSATSYRSILRAVEREEGSIVVAGTHARNLLGQAFFGSTARQTILRSPVPVVIVRSR
jgi:nucleotide-binding universal stress UspA family protein